MPDVVGREAARDWAGGGEAGVLEADRVPAAASLSPCFHWLPAEELLLCHQCRDEATAVQKAFRDHSSNKRCREFERLYVCLYDRDYGPEKGARCELDDPATGKREKFWCPAVKERRGCRFDTDLDHRSAQALLKASKEATTAERIAWLRVYFRSVVPRSKKQTVEQKRADVEARELEDFERSWALEYFPNGAPLPSPRKLAEYFGDDASFGVSFGLRLLVNRPEVFVVEEEGADRVKQLQEVAAKTYRQVWSTGNGPAAALNMILEEFWGSPLSRTAPAVAPPGRSGEKADQRTKFFRPLESHDQGNTPKELRVSRRRTAFFLTLLRHSPWGSRLQMLTPLAKPPTAHVLCFRWCECRKYSAPVKGKKKPARSFYLRGEGAEKARADHREKMKADGYESFEADWPTTKWRRDVPGK
ncbi:unnamed protein product [Amoebophrya sp. A120]|nr:unnamed protein product [Amoebophrya sp. A120]|eukprot:GSA120T00024445001.1